MKISKEQKMDILLIDDSKEDRDLINNYIKRFKTDEKMQLDECNCLQKGMDSLNNNNYDLILLDLVLPETDGINTIKSIIKHLQSIDKNIPIVVLTALEDYSLGRKAWDLGIKDYLIKDEIQAVDLSRAINFATCDNENLNKSMIF
jgi:two-component system, cell cycle sensor histidine kinase and response regulator CckA